MSRFGLTVSFGVAVPVERISAEFNTHTVFYGRRAKTVSGSNTLMAGSARSRE